MTQRLLEGEVRAASMSGAELSFRLRTQASNFSLCRRSPDWLGIATVSMPNWRKHSASSVRDASLRSTNAARAVALRGLLGGRTKAFSMSRGRLHFSKLLWNGRTWLERHKGPTSRHRSSIALLVQREKGHYEAKSRVDSGVSGYSFQRRNNSAPLVPPKPKEFDMA